MIFFSQSEECFQGKNFFAVHNIYIAYKYNLLNLYIILIDDVRIDDSQKDIPKPEYLKKYPKKMNTTLMEEKRSVPKIKSSM